MFYDIVHGYIDPSLKGHINCCSHDETETVVWLNAYVSSASVIVSPANSYIHQQRSSVFLKGERPNTF